ncbi:MAG TPA: leucine--tRNA ligase [Anaerolineaceae bacterium]|nr:leucine--tRNA ligase [Anaerolineaceae bacterium]
MIDPTSIPPYKPEEIEPKWQARWAADKLYETADHPEKQKFYALTMLPYPSGDLHIGHWYAMTPSDARARFKRMQGYNVFFPIGFDAFGLPAENAAIKRRIHPKTWTYANIARMRTQLRSMGNMFDWKSEIISSDPKYYRWTQWFFLQFFKHNLAYQKEAPVDFCPNCNTTLAREQVQGEDRHCERCGTPVIRKDLRQWLFRITNYAEELLDFSDIDWPDTIKTLQTKWIGKSKGASVTFTSEQGDPIEVFTTRPDTLWGVTFMVLAPEHPLVEKLTTAEQAEIVRAYQEQAKRQSDIQREAVDRTKTGVFTGAYAVNPVSGERVQVWTADYVLMGYGSGAIMAVPAHDQRDFEFARQYGLPIRVVIQPEGSPEQDPAEMTAALEAHGAMVHSGPLSGTPEEKTMEAAIAYIERLGVGKGAVTYRLHDWLISRQRYWGAPIPIIYCPHCGTLPVPEEQLPVLLPDDVEWLPTGESPLKLHPTWRFTTCPVCGGPAERETDTMDTFMCSSWYFMRYLSPDYDTYPFDPALYRKWMPVDTYTGGSEHATMHLMYVRFFHKACRDCGITSGPEPMLQLRNQGMVLGEDGEKMSKSRGNVIAPDDLVSRYGADTVRSYLTFFARWEVGGPWNSSGIEGNSRWLRRVWAMLLEPAQTDASPETLRALRRKTHQVLRAITYDYENFEFNTIVSSLMELLNEMGRAKNAGAWGSPEWNECADIYLRMLAPLCPHIAEELWERLGKPYSIHTQSWPVVDEAAARDEEITLVVQVNGKLRDRILVPPGITDAEAQEKALASEAVRAALEGKPVRKVIIVPGRLVNIVA